MKTHGIKWLGIAVLLLAGFLMVAPSALAAEAGGYSATCKDGTAWTGSSKRGACRGHKGVKSWTSEPASTAETGTSEKESHKRKSHGSEETREPSRTASATPEETSATAGAVSATCKDGTAWTGKSKRGACRGHKGVASWSGGAAPAAATESTAETSHERKSRSAESEESNRVASATPTAASAAGGAVSATCKDGTPWSGTSKRGACRGHKGVASWGAAAAATPVNQTRPEAAPTPASYAPTATATRTASAGGAMGAPAPGGGAGKVWVNTESKTYHCQGTKWYGTTKHGEYMTQAQATAQGYHADHGKACSN